MTDAAKSHLAMLAVSALVAGSFSLGSLAAPHVAPQALNGVRFVLAAVLLWIFLRFKGEAVPRSALAHPWRYLILGGLFSFYFVMMFEGLETAPPVSAAAVYATTPLLTAFFGLLVLGQRTSRPMLGAILVGGAGAIWVIFRADLSLLLGFELGRGEFVYFLGCIAHSVYVPMSRLLNRGESASVFTLGIVAGGTVAIAIYGGHSVLATDWTALPAIVFVTIVYTAVAATAASFILIQYAAMRIPAANVMAYTYLVPVWVIGWQVALGHGLPPLAVFPGILLITVALLLLLRIGRAPQ